MSKLKNFYGYNNSKKIYQVDKNDLPLFLVWNWKFISAFKALRVEV